MTITEVGCQKPLRAQHVRSPRTGCHLLIAVNPQDAGDLSMHMLRPYGDLCGFAASRAPWTLDPGSLPNQKSKICNLTSLVRAQHVRSPRTGCHLLIAVNPQDAGDLSVQMLRPY